MADKFKIDADLVGGTAYVMISDVPLEVYADAPDPLTDYQAFVEWSQAMNDLALARARAKQGGDCADH